MQLFMLLLDQPDIILHRYLLEMEQFFSIAACEFEMGYRYPPTSGVSYTLWKVYQLNLVL